MQSTGRNRERLVLPWALGASVGVHVLLFLVSLWIPLQRETSAAERSEETPLRFTFAAPGEEPAQTAEPPAGLPLPLPVQRPPAEPPPIAAATEPAVEPPVVPRRARPLPTAEEPPGRPAEASPSLLEPHAGGVYRPRPQPRPPLEGREFDVDRALTNFGRELARHRQANPPAPAQPGPPSNIFVPDLTNLPSSGFGVGNLQFQSRDYDWNDYGRQIYMAIWRAWHNRLYQTTDEFEKWAYGNNEWILAHQSGIRFVIQRSGQVTGIALEAEAGCPPLDASAIDALAEVILPPLPGDFPRDQEVVQARFIARGEVQGLRPTLNYLKHKLNLF